MKPIPISAAERISKEFGYDQVVIIARKVGDNPEPNGEHVTTYGVTKAHCAVAARAGDFLKYKVMGWAKDGDGNKLTMADFEKIVLNTNSSEQIRLIVDLVDLMFRSGAFQCDDEDWPHLSTVISERKQSLTKNN